MSQSDRKIEITEVDRIATGWLIRLGNDELNETEMNEFAEWLASDPQHVKAFAEAEDFIAHMSNTVRKLTSNKFETFAEPSSQPKLKGEIRSHGHPSRMTSSPKIWFGVSLAMAAVWLFSVNLVVPRQAHWFNAYFSDYSTGTGEMREFVLSDGSRLLLNTNSAATVRFNDTLRQVVLHHGEGRFTVAADMQRPFEVVADHLNLRALGTVFDVRISDPDTVDVIVEEHAVSATLTDTTNLADSGANSRLIRQGQRLSVAGLSQLPLPGSIDLEQVTAWQRRLLVIDNQPLSFLLAELARYRNGRIFINDTGLNDIRFSGVLPLDDPEAALESLQKLLHLRQTRLGPWWIILHR